MTRTARIATTATLTLALGIALMATLRFYAHAHLLETGAATRRAMTAHWADMGWLLALGPVSGFLIFGSLVALVTLFVRWIVK